MNRELANTTYLFIPFLHLYGKLRRTYYFFFNRNYIHRQLSRRRGACKRCGACCKILHRCPFLIGANNGNRARCLIFFARHPNCRIFPLDERDLRERDFVMPEEECGFYFVDDVNRSGEGWARSD